jgi:hypothetical protein
MASVRGHDTWFLVPAALFIALTAAGGTATPTPAATPAATPARPAASPPASAKPAAAPTELGDLELPPPPFSDGVFPCSDCHEKGAEVDRTRRELSQHDFAFEHDAEHRWCLDCHDADDRDKLRLASGDLISFGESFRLCGQCHGDKYRDWRVGVHGRRTGYWNGKKRYLLCVNCHDPHSPRFKPIRPEPPPQHPEQLR